MGYNTAIYGYLNIDQELKEIAINKMNKSVLSGSCWHYNKSDNTITCCEDKPRLYKEWLYTIITTLSLLGYIINGVMSYFGDEDLDIGIIKIINNKMFIADIKYEYYNDTNYIYMEKSIYKKLRGYAKYITHKDMEVQQKNFCIPVAKFVRNIIHGNKANINEKTFDDSELNYEIYVCPSYCHLFHFDYDFDFFFQSDNGNSCDNSFDDTFDDDINFISDDSKEDTGANGIQIT